MGKAVVAKEKRAEKATLGRDAASPSIKSVVPHKAALSVNTALSGPEAKADAACKHALAQAQNLPPAKRMIGMKMAQALCAKLKAVVAKEKRAEKATMMAHHGLPHGFGTVPAAKHTKHTKHVHMLVAPKIVEAKPKTLNKVKQKVINALQKKKTTKKVKAKHMAKRVKAKHMAKRVRHASDITSVHKTGHMPRTIVGALKHEYHALKAQKQEEDHKADIMCRMAKKKVRDTAGVTTPAMRVKAVEAAIRFCHQTKRAAKQEEKANNKKLDSLVRTEGARYGLKVVKMKHQPSNVANVKHDRITMQPSKASVEEEEKMFHKAIGKQADFASDKNALHEAMREAEHHALKGQVRRMKAKINKSLSGQQKKADILCALTKKRIAQLGGAGKAAERDKHLQQALKICHASQAVLARERKADYAALNRVTGMARKWNAKHGNKQKVKHEMTKKEAMMTKKNKAEPVKKVKKNTGHIGQIESSVRARAMTMCEILKRKVRKLGAEKAEVRALALRQAKAFCKKANDLVAKEVALDNAALEASKKKAKGLKRKATGMVETAKKMKVRKKVAKPTEAKKVKKNTKNAKKVVSNAKNAKPMKAKNVVKPKAKKMKVKKAKKNGKKVKKRSMKSSAIIRAMLPQPKKKQAAAKKEAKENHDLGHMGHIEGPVRQHAVSMCKMMQHKVRKKWGGQEAQAVALDQAKAFCKKAKELVAKEVKLDRLALKANKKNAKILKRKAKGMETKQRKLIAEEEAVKEETKLRRARLQKIATRKKKIKAATEHKIDKLNEKRMTAQAVAALNKLKAKQAKLGYQRKKLTAKMKAHIHKVMKANKHCQAIMKNLRQMKQQILELDATLASFTES